MNVSRLKGRAVKWNVSVPSINVVVEMAKYGIVNCSEWIARHAVRIVKVASRQNANGDFVTNANLWFWPTHLLLSIIGWMVVTEPADAEFTSGLFVRVFNVVHDGAEDAIAVYARCAKPFAVENDFKANSHCE